MNRSKSGVLMLSALCALGLTATALTAKDTHSPPVRVVESPPCDLSPRPDVFMESFQPEAIALTCVVFSAPAVPVALEMTPPAFRRPTTTYRLDRNVYVLRATGYQTLRAAGEDLLVRPGWRISL
jgi:hypothetical protein